MRSRHSLYKSSILVSVPCLAASALIWLLSSFYSGGVFSSSMMAVFFFTLFSRLWADISTKKIEASITPSTRALFPGERMTVDLRIKNDKLIPVPWMEVFMPLDKNLSLLPEETREPDSAELIHLSGMGANTSLLGTHSCGKLLYYEEASFSITLEARARGIAPLKEWSLNTGDGFGLSQSDMAIPEAGVIAVYPRIIDVNTHPFTKNLWNADSGTHGVMEDISVIKSTRDYQTTDSLKHINWRLLARGESLKVNVFENILPRSIHLIFDGESFSGPSPHKEEMEKTISAIASVMLRLRKARIKSFLSLCEGENTRALTIKPEDGLESALYALSAYNNYAQTLDTAGTGIIERESVFNRAAIIESTLSVGHFFYFTYDSGKLKNSSLLQALGKESVTIISVLGNQDEVPFDTIRLDRIIAEGRNG